jgi:hypothetical protein
MPSRYNPTEKDLLLSIRKKDGWVLEPVREKEKNLSSF